MEDGWLAVGTEGRARMDVLLAQGVYLRKRKVRDERRQRVQLAGSLARTICERRVPSCPHEHLHLTYDGAVAYVQPQHLATRRGRT